VIVPRCAKAVEQGLVVYTRFSLKTHCHFSTERQGKKEAEDQK